jgi:hypothetical protein
MMVPKSDMVQLDGMGLVRLWLGGIERSGEPMMVGLLMEGLEL